MSTTLIAISEDLVAFKRLLDDSLDESGELSTETEAALDAWYAELSQDRDAKLDSYCGLIWSLELRASVRRSEQERLEKLARVDENAAARLKARLKDFFVIQDLKRVDTARFRLSLCNNGGVLPIEITVPPAELPERFRRVRVEADTDAIRKAMSSGDRIEGVKLLARGQHLRIN